MIAELREAIHQLERSKVKREDIRILISELMARKLADEIYYTWPEPFNHVGVRFEGIEMNTVYPFNEIVVFHKDACRYGPGLFVRILPDVNKDRRERAEEILQSHVDPHCWLMKGCIETAVDAMIEFKDTIC